MARKYMASWWTGNISPQGRQEILHLKVDKKYFNPLLVRVYLAFKVDRKYFNSENISIEVDRKYFHRVVTRKYQLNGTEEEATEVDSFKCLQLLQHFAVCNHG